MQTFSTFEICEALEIPHERLRQWLKLGFIIPLIPAQGQGTRAEFSKADVYGIALFNELVGFGWKREVAARCFKGYVKLDKFDKWEFIGLVMKKGREPFLINYEDIDTLLTVMKSHADDWHQIHVINFGILKEAVDEKLTKE